MLLRLSSWIDRVSSGRVTLAALALFLLFMILVLPRQAASAQAAAGGAGSPDTSLLYTTQDLYRFAESYGETGRQAYVQAHKNLFDSIEALDSQYEEVFQDGEHIGEASVADRRRLKLDKDH